MTSTLLHLGDCLDVLRTMPDASVDSIVTDPPYDLTTEVPHVASGGYGGKRTPEQRAARKGFMGKTWDGTGIAFRVELWAEALRVLRPGGHLLAFGGTRTYHRMAVAIEDAGFEIRDSLHWMYGQGFSKAHLWDEPTDAEWQRNPRQAEEDQRMVAAGWDGWARGGLKPAHEPIVLARKPLAESTVAAQVLATGTGGLNVAATRVQTNGEQRAAHHGTGRGVAMVGNAAENWRQPYQSGDAGKVTTTVGRWPSNLLLSHAPGCERVGVTRVKGHSGYPNGPGGRSRSDYASTDYGRYGADANTPQSGYADADGRETVEDWRCVDGCPIKILAAQSGERTSGSRRALPRKTRDGWGMAGGDATGDTGTAARFFPQFTVDKHDTFPYNSRIVSEVNQCPAKQVHGDNSTNVMVDGIDTGANQAAENFTVNLSTDGSGNKPTGQSLTDAISTTSTTTRPTIGSKTSPVSPQKNTTTTTSDYESDISSALMASSDESVNDAVSLSHWASSAHEPLAPIMATAKLAESSTFGNGDEHTLSTPAPISGHGITNTSYDRQRSPVPTAESDLRHHDSAANTAPSPAETKPPTTVQNSFFPTFAPDDAAPFRYVSKASRAERNAGCEELPEVSSASAVGMKAVTAAEWGNPDQTIYERKTVHSNHHPCVKPQKLMEWLCTLITPPGGVILDPFLGSGSTGVAAVALGFSFVGIEREEDYLAIAQARITHAQPSEREAAA